MIEVSAPGKLYIAGEYAVVEPGNPAIIIAVDQFVTATLTEASENGSIKSAQFSTYPIYFTRKDDALVLDKRDNPFNYILAAIETVEKYAKECGQALKLFHLSIESGLDNGHGTKYGLGSSGAVTVATVEALCRFYALPFDEMRLFKLAALAHLSIQNNGSCGDVAASVYGGWLAFSTFDQKWVVNKQGHLTLSELLQEPWPGLAVKKLTPPKELNLMIGWTGTPASTANLVDRVAKSDTKLDYQKFVQASNVCVHQLVTAFAQNDLAGIQAGLRTNRQLLKDLSDLTHVVIETPALSRLIEIAEKHGGSAKSSGAGGGDCGIAIFSDAVNCKDVLIEWDQAQIFYLPLQVYVKGARDES